MFLCLMRSCRPKPSVEFPWCLHMIGSFPVRARDINPATLQTVSIHRQTRLKTHFALADVDRYKTHRLQVLSFGLDPHPLYVHQLSDGMAHVLLTDNLIFCGSGGRTGRVVITSNLLSRTSLENDNPANISRLVARSTVQQLNLPAGERILALYPHTRPQAGRENSLDTCTVVTSSSVYVPGAPV